ncbi:hypothetical protein Tco_1258394 [Tanacetum coccineum]
MAMRLLVLISPKWSATTATREDILLGSAELQEIKTTMTRKAQEGVCLWKHLLPQLVSCDGLGGYDWSDQAEEWPNYALMAYSSSSSNSEISLNLLSDFENASNSLNKLIECQIVDNYKKGLGYENYNAVPHPYTRNLMPPTPDLSFTGLDEFVNEPVVENCKTMSSEEEPKFFLSLKSFLLFCVLGDEMISSNKYLAEVGEDTQTSYQDAAIELGKECLKTEPKQKENSQDTVIVEIVVWLDQEADMLGLLYLEPQQITCLMC